MPASTTEEQDDQVYDEDFEPVARDTGCSSFSGSSAMPYWPECPMMRGTPAISPVTICLFVTV